MSEKPVRISVAGPLPKSGRYVICLRVMGIKFFRTEPDEISAIIKAQELVGVMEARLHVKFGAIEVADEAQGEDEARSWEEEV